MQWNTPFRFTATTFCHSSKVMSVNRLNPSRPAALTRTVTGPNCARIAASAAWTCLGCADGEQAAGRGLDARSESPAHLGHGRVQPLGVLIARALEPHSPHPH